MYGGFVKMDILSSKDFRIESVVMVVKNALTRKKKLKLIPYE